MSASRLVTVYGAAAKLESTYGTAASFGVSGSSYTSNNETVLLMEEAVLSLQYANDGARGPAGYVPGQLQAAAPSGCFGEVTIRHRFRGPGAAFTASVRQPDTEALLRACGHDVTLTTGASAQLAFAPTQYPTNPYNSATVLLFARNKVYTMTGVYGAYSATIEAGGFWVEEFALRGIVASDPTEIALPTFTHYTTIPPKVEAMGLSINGSTAQLKPSMIEFQTQQEHSPRVRAVTGVHAGFSPDQRNPQMIITLEQEALATINPYSVRRAGTLQTLELDVGGTQYNRGRIEADFAHLMNVEEEADGATAMWKLTYALGVGTAAANAAYTITSR